METKENPRSIGGDKENNYEDSAAQEINDEAKETDSAAQETNGGAQEADISVEKMNGSIEEMNSVISRNIERLMREKGWDQTKLRERMKNLGGPVSQGTVSGVLKGKGNITVANLVKFAAALDAEVPDLLTSGEGELSALHGKDRKKAGLMISDTKDPAFKGYLGRFCLYFYKTTGKEPELVRGEMQIGDDSSGREGCIVTLTLFTGEEINVDQKNIDVRKCYTGEMIVSTSMHSAYCYLYGEEMGEICFLVFHHWYLLHNELKCAMASAITTSSGSNRRPTVHRICLCRKPVDDGMLPFLKGQLLLNDANIILSQSEYARVMRDEQVPQAFRELLEQAAQKEKYILVKERGLINEELKECDQAKWISYLRSLSAAPRYNKISMRTDEMLFHLLYPQK